MASADLTVAVEVFLKALLQTSYQVGGNLVVQALRTHHCSQFGVEVERLHAVGAAFEMLVNAGSEFIVDGAIEQVRSILETRRGALEAVTRRLIECEVIDGSELRDIVEASTGSPQLVPGTDAERRPPRPVVDVVDMVRPAADAAAAATRVFLPYAQH